VRDPARPKPVGYVPSPPNTWSLHLQTHEDLLLVVNAKTCLRNRSWRREELLQRQGRVHAHAAPVAPQLDRRLAVYDIANPNASQIGFMPVEGGGLHRLWLCRRTLAYASALLDGFTDYIPHHHRHGRSDQAQGGGALLVARL